mmetsp:Transcript_21656/g.46343  ORF Transcript_21656/g.46343 Transcript_21656/m.46343 type:complete len:240 (+) Transcript_21656:495-1214(+)
MQLVLELCGGLGHVVEIEGVHPRLALGVRGLVVQAAAERAEVSGGASPAAREAGGGVVPEVVGVGDLVVLVVTADGAAIRPADVAITTAAGGAYVALGEGHAALPPAGAEAFPCGAAIPERGAFAEPPARPEALGGGADAARGADAAAGAELPLVAGVEVAHPTCGGVTAALAGIPPVVGGGRTGALAISGGGSPYLLGVEGVPADRILRHLGDDHAPLRLQRNDALRGRVVAPPPQRQ